MLEFNDQTAREAIESGKPLVIDFWATWFCDSKPARLHWPPRKLQVVCHNLWEDHQELLFCPVIELGDIRFGCQWLIAGNGGWLQFFN